MFSKFSSSLMHRTNKLKCFQPSVIIFTGKDIKALHSDGHGILTEGKGSVPLTSLLQHVMHYFFAFIKLLSKTTQVRDDVDCTEPVTPSVNIPYDVILK
jgi:hypothetical protein